MRQSVGRAALRLGALLALAAACGPGERKAPPLAESVDSTPLRAGRFAAVGGALYRDEDGTRVLLAVLPGGGAAPDTLIGCPASIPELETGRFQRLVLAPDSLWVAWETAGPGSCVGVAGPRSPPVQVLGYWSGAVPDSLLWAPAGGYLAVWLAQPGQRRSLAVFRAAGGAGGGEGGGAGGGGGGRVEMPWELECGYSGDCDVARVQWLGGTLLNVEIRMGPAELSVPFEVNLGTAALAEPPEEF